jgi:glycosyltransferase involved in cell wall biosynthesis
LTKPQYPPEPKMTTIVHLLPHFRNDGNGIVNAVVDLACSQACSGFQVTCIGAYDGAFAPLLRSRQVAALVIINPRHDPFAQFSYILRLYALLTRLRPLVVHAHTVPTALAAKALQPLLGFNLVTTAHNDPRWRSALLGVGDRVVCVSAAVAEGMRRLRISEAKLKVVLNGPLGSPRRPKIAHRPIVAKLDSPAILTITGLHTFKGVQDLIEAFSVARKSVPGLSLYIVGHGPANAKLRRRAAHAGCEDCIHFLGFVDDPRPYLAHADIFVLASHREAFGLVLAEAREAGCAIIGTNVGGIPEVLEGGRAGILVPPRDPSALGQALVRLLTDQDALKDWQRRALANLNWLNVERVSREMLAVYDDSRIRAEHAVGAGRPGATKQVPEA